MKYVICSIEMANSNGIAVNEGHPTDGENVCLTSSDILFCSELEGSFEERVESINGTVFDSAREVNEVIKTWRNDHDK